MRGSIAHAGSRRQNRSERRRRACFRRGGSPGLCSSPGVGEGDAGGLALRTYLFEGPKGQGGSVLYVYEAKGIDGQSRSARMAPACILPMAAINFWERVRF